MFVFEFRIKKLTNLWRLLVGVPVVVLFVIFSRSLGLVLLHNHVFSFTDLVAARTLPPTSVHACTSRVVKQVSD